MTCGKNSGLCANAARRNGISGLVSRYLNTLGSWDTYRDVGSLEEIPGKVAGVTAAYFGLKDLAGKHPYVAGALGAIVGVHLLEQVTGAASTFGLRMLARGEPLGKYRGIVLRRSPFTPRAAGLLNQLTGGRVSKSDGLYFHEAGRTWHYQSLTVDMGDQPRTLTTVNSFSLPYREFFFDRPLAPQAVVDLVKGGLDPDTVPGFIGSTNELENITPLGTVKRAFFAANWLLLDEGERDSGGGGLDYADYGALVNGTAPAADREGGSSPRVEIGRAPGPVVYSAENSYDGWPSTAAGRVPLQRAEPPAYGVNLFNRNTTAPPRQVTQLVQVNGKDCPLVISRLTSDILSGAKLADAAYYDQAQNRWRVIDDREDCQLLARMVADGKFKLNPEDYPG